MVKTIVLGILKGIKVMLKLEIAIIFSICKHISVGKRASGRSGEEIRLRDDIIEADFGGNNIIANKRWLHQHLI